VGPGLRLKKANDTGSLRRLRPVHEPLLAPYSPSMDAVTVAFVSVVASALVAVGGLVANYWIARGQQSQARRLGQIQLEKEFLMERYRQRLQVYAPVMRSLGAVTDAEVMQADADLHVLLAPDLLRRAAVELREHLFGDAGLVMDKETRDWIYAARFEALSYLAGRTDDEDKVRLAEAFNQARRAVRRDLGMIDDKVPTTVVGLTGRFRESNGDRDA
jgi:hypothetical protein